MAKKRQVKLTQDQRERVERKLDSFAPEGPAHDLSELPPDLPEAPPCPPHLSAEEKRIWHRVTASLSRLHVLRDTDWAALEMLVCLMNDYQKLRTIVRGKDGMSYPTKTAEGNLIMRPRPEFLMLPETERRLTTLLKEFGLTPNARGAVDDIPELNGKGRGAKEQRAALGLGDKHADKDDEFAN